MQRIFFIIAVILFLTSCERDITVDLPQPESKIVVEGYIEAGKPAYVLISKSTGYFAPFDSASLINSAVKNAVVIISDGTITDTLIQLSSQYGYLYISAKITGEEGRAYNLRIITQEGQELVVSTFVHPAVTLDSVWFKTVDNNDSLGFAWAHLTDPDTLGNSYRWFAKRLGKDKDFIAPIGSAFEDKFINGKSFDFGYNRGSIPNSTAADDNNDERGFFKTGDTIVIKFTSIGRESFEFWRSAEAQYANNGNPFAAITYLKSNITGGIGIFEGYSLSYDTIIARKE